MKKRLLPLITFLMLTGISFSQTHTILVTVPDTAEIVYIAGSINNWNPASDTMTLVSETPKMYSFEFEMADSLLDDVKYKFLSGPDWKYEQKRAADFSFLTDSATAVVDTFLAVYHRAQADSVTIDVLVPVQVYELNLTGSFNGWNPTSHPMELIDSSANGKEFVLTIFTLDTTTLKFKFIAGPGWPYEQVAGDYVYTETDNGVVVCDEFKAIFNPNEVGDITINIKVPEGTSEVWLIGSFNNWSTETAIQATKNTDTTFSVVIEDVADIEYKAYSHNDWAYEEAKDAAGNSLDANRTASFLTGPVFNITVAFWKELYNPPTPVNNIEKLPYLMYATDGHVIITGEFSRVAIFDLSGRLVQAARAKGSFTSQQLRSGIYIIQTDNHVRKISVQ